MRLLLLNKCKRNFTDIEKQYSLLLTFTDDFVGKSYLFTVTLYAFYEENLMNFYLKLSIGNVESIFKIILSNTERQSYHCENSIDSTFLLNFCNKFFTNFTGKSLVRRMVKKYDSISKDSATQRCDIEAAFL